jgi:hypothetical protein
LEKIHGMHGRRRCPGLRELDVRWCSKLTDASIVEVARGCPGLTELDAWGCSMLTDASIVEVTRGCPTPYSARRGWVLDAHRRVDRRWRAVRLSVLDVRRCSKLTDVSIAEVAARGCPGLMELSRGGVLEAHRRVDRRSGARVSPAPSISW